MKPPRLTKKQYESLAGAIAIAQMHYEDQKDSNELALLDRAWHTVQDWYFEGET